MAKTMDKIQASQTKSIRIGFKKYFKILLILLAGVFNYSHSVQVAKLVTVHKQD